MSLHDGELTVAEAAPSLAEYQRFHNHVRPHMPLDYLTPSEYLHQHSGVPSSLICGELAQEQIIPFFAFSAPIRTAIYTSSAVESLNSTVRRAVRSKGHLPRDDAAKKLIYLALRGLAAKWKRPPQFWWQVRGEFAIRFEERFTMTQE